MTTSDDKDNEPVNHSGFGMHANKEPEPAAPEPAAQEPASEDAAPEPQAPTTQADVPPLPENAAPEEPAATDPNAPPPFPDEDKPKFDNLPPEDEFGSNAKAAETDSAPKFDNLPPEDEFGASAQPKAAETDSVPKFDNLPPEDEFGAEAQAKAVAEPGAAHPQLDNLPPDDLGAPITADSSDKLFEAETTAPGGADFAPGEQASGDHGATIQFEDEHGERNLIAANTTQNLTSQCPHIEGIIAAVGWEQAAIEEQKLDIDLSVFLLDRNDKTRKDEDFIFYNNENILDGDIIHTGDSRTGAGEGDDEAIHMKLDSVPYDTLKVVFVLSIYDDEFKGHNFEMVRDVFFRIIDKSNNREIFCYPISEEALKGQITAIQVGELYREGANWMFESKETAETGGLAKVATEYGIVVKEMQSVDLNVEDESSKL